MKNYDKISQKKVKLKLGDIGGKQQPFDVNLDDKLRLAIDPKKQKFSRHCTLDENKQIGSFKP